MKPRDAETVLKSFAKGYPLVAITGPRQSGKTTLARNLFQQKPYVSLENPDTRLFAEEDPRGFLAEYGDGAVLDEIQHCPHLFSYLQQIVDEAKIPGHFILTGSQQFGIMSGITQSLAGRVALLQLLPFTLAECYERRLSTVPLNRAIRTGLYPPVHDRDLDPFLWYGNYIQTYIQRDLRNLIHIRDLSAFQRFIRLCAGRAGHLLNLSAMAADCGITQNTARSWISILEASYIVFLLQPHHENFRKRLVKTPKIYFYDSGLVCWLLAIRTDEQLKTHPARGHLFENLIIAELLKARFNQGTHGGLFFWRDRNGREVDVLLEEGPRLRPIEVKSGQTVNPDFFKNLLKWMDLAGDRGAEPTLVYGGEHVRKEAKIRVASWRETPFLMDRAIDG